MRAWEPGSRLGKGGKRRHVGMDRWGWQHLQPWLEHRIELPVGALTLARRDPQTLKRPPYHPDIQHANLGVTSIYLQGIGQSEIIDTVYRRPAPMLPASTALH